MDGRRKPRKTSDAKGGFPFSDLRVPFLLVTGGPVDVEGEGTNWAYDAREKADLISAAEENEEYVVFTVWPGKHRSDFFVIDDLDEAKAALGA